jgi:integrase
LKPGVHRTFRTTLGIDAISWRQGAFSSPLEAREMKMSIPIEHTGQPSQRPSWNKGKLTGSKPPLQPRHVWAIRTRLQLAERTRDLVLFNLAVDSKLRGCDVVSLRVEDVAPHGYAIDRAAVRQKKTGRPVNFEITEQTRNAIDAYLKSSGKKPGEFLFSGRRGPDRCLTTRKYARLLAAWIASIGLDPSQFGTHSIRRTKATLIYRRTGNLRAVQLLLGHTKIESTVRYLGVEVDYALTITEQVDI